MNNFYLPTGTEVDMFTAAFRQRLPLLVKGPTGCGKTRFVEYMAERLSVPLITVPCHEDLTAADLIGRYLLEGGDTVWMDGPLTRAVRQGAICYLDEVVEARADTTVVIHPLTDHRRELNIERLGQRLKAPDNFMLVMSYNPGYQSVLKDLKPSTRQRMVGLEFGYPDADLEVRILQAETQIDEAAARDLVKLGNAIRRLDVSSMPEVASTRTLVTAARLIVGGVAAAQAAHAAMVVPLTDDAETGAGLTELIASFLGERQ